MCNYKRVMSIFVSEERGLQKIISPIEKMKGRMSYTTP